MMKSDSASDFHSNKLASFPLTSLSCFGTCNMYHVHVTIKMSQIAGDLPYVFPKKKKIHHISWQTKKKKGVTKVFLDAVLKIRLPFFVVVVKNNLEIFLKRKQNGMQPSGAFHKLTQVLYTYLLKRCTRNVQ